MRFLHRFLGTCLLAASLLPAETLLLLPIAGDAETTPDITTVNRLFRDALEAGRGDGVLSPPSSPACETRTCALEAARAAEADAVVYSGLHRLGTRWIFSATVMTVADGESFGQRLTAASIEDMEAITRRMADALIQRKDADQVASVDNITEREDAREPERRRSLYSGGMGFGYLFPVSNSFSYNTIDQNFPGPDDTLSNTYSQIIRLTWLNTWEFRNDLALGAEAAWSIPHAVGVDLNLRYLFNRGDFTPFAGGGVGLHYVRGDEDADADRRNSGPALNAQAGMMLFRTYDVNVMLRGKYQVIFNSDVDNGFVADVGVTLRQKEAGKREGGLDDSLGRYWAYAAVGLIFLLLAAAN